MARGSKLWFNGKIASVEDTKISLFTHALHYGMGVFEGIRAYRQKNGGGAIFRLREHMDRFGESLKILGLPLPHTVDELCKASVEVCRANGFDECYVRPIAYIADGPLGLNPGAEPPVHVAILNWEWGSYLGDQGMKEGIRVCTSSFNRPHPNSVLTKGKITGQYVTGVLAKREAIRNGFDEGLMLDPEGYLSEGTGENIFMVKDGVIKTTPLTSVLNGITRKTILEYLRQSGHRVTEERFTRDELWCADEIFLTGTAAEITPVREVDHRTIGTGRPGPITQKTQQDYLAMVRGDLPEYGRNWLTRI